MKINKLVIASLSFFLSTVALSGTDVGWDDWDDDLSADSPVERTVPANKALSPTKPSPLFPQKGLSVITLTLEAARTQGGDTQTLFLQPQIEKTYTNDKTASNLFAGELFYGRQYQLNGQFSGQIGMAIAAATKAQISGEIWDDADPEFNNFIYNYKINHARLAMKGKILALMPHALKPYIGGSIGIAFNRAQDFTSTPLIFEALPQPSFSAGTKTALTYGFQLGLEREINKNWQVGLGYEFTDWGGSQLSRLPGQILGNGLSQAHGYTNGLLLSLSYF